MLALSVNALRLVQVGHQASSASVLLLLLLDLCTVTILLICLFHSLAHMRGWPRVASGALGLFVLQTELGVVDGCRLMRFDLG